MGQAPRVGAGGHVRGRLGTVDGSGTGQKRLGSGPRGRQRLVEKVHLELVDGRKQPRAVHTAGDTSRRVEVVGRACRHGGGGGDGIGAIGPRHGVGARNPCGGTRKVDGGCGETRIERERERNRTRGQRHRRDRQQRGTRNQRVVHQVLAQGEQAGSEGGSACGQQHRGGGGGEFIHIGHGQHKRVAGGNQGRQHVPRQLRRPLDGFRVAGRRSGDGIDGGEHSSHRRGRN